MPVTDEIINAFDDQMINVITEIDCDTCMKIYLPKQLQLDDGAEDLLMWFKETSPQLGVGSNPQRDMKCVNFLTSTLALSLGYSLHHQWTSCAWGAHNATPSRTCSSWLHACQAAP
jgi:hypothetical protein